MQMEFVNSLEVHGSDGKRTAYGALEKSRHIEVARENTNVTAIMNRDDVSTKYVPTNPSKYLRVKDSEMLIDRRKTTARNARALHVSKQRPAKKKNNRSKTSGSNTTLSSKKLHVPRKVPQHMAANTKRVDNERHATSRRGNMTPPSNSDVRRKMPQYGQMTGKHNTRNRKQNAPFCGTVEREKTPKATKNVLRKNKASISTNTRNGSKGGGGSRNTEFTLGHGKLKRSSHATAPSRKHDESLSLGQIMENFSGSLRSSEAKPSKPHAATVGKQRLVSNGRQHCFTSSKNYIRNPSARSSAIRIAKSQKEPLERDRRMKKSFENSLR